MRKIAEILLPVGVACSMLPGCVGGARGGVEDAGTQPVGCAGAMWGGSLQIGTYEDDEAFDIGVDAQCALYVAGRTQGAFTGAANNGLEDMLVVAFEPAGTMKWAAQMGSPGSDSAERIAVASDGTTLVAGYAAGDVARVGAAVGDNDYVVAKLGPGGGIEWIKQRGSVAYDRASGIAMDPAGAAIVAGITMESEARGSEIFASKLDLSGMPVLDERLGTPADEVVGGAALSPQGNLYLAGGTTGLFGDFGGGSFDLYLTKLTSSLTVEWARQLGTVDIDGAQGVAVDNAGNAYVAAVSYSDLTTGALEGDGVRDAFLLKYDAAGVLQWVSRPAWTPGKHSVPWDVAVDQSGVYMVGWTEGTLEQGASQGGNDAFVLKVNHQGVLEWVRQIGTAAEDEARAVAVDAGGRVFVAGFTEGGIDGHIPLGKKDIFVVAFDAGGAKL